MTAPYAELLLDTSRAPASLGRRGIGGGDRHLIFRHGGLQLDVLLQRGGAEGAFLWGQLYGAKSGAACADARVTLLDEDEKPLARGRTDAFGEFSFAALRLVEGVLGVEVAALGFRCWLAKDGASGDAPLAGGRTA